MKQIHFVQTGHGNRAEINPWSWVGIICMVSRPKQGHRKATLDTWRYLSREARGCRKFGDEFQLHTANIWLVLDHDKLCGQLDISSSDFLSISFR